MIGFLLNLPPAAKVLALFGFLTAEASTFSFGPANLLLNVLTVAVALFVAIKAGRSKLKDETIRTLNDNIEAKDRRYREAQEEIMDSKAQVRQIEAGAAHVREQLVAAEAKFEVQAQYTAEHALTAVMTSMDKSDAAHERRHREVMLALKNVQTALERT